jgi:hypothetical protein
MQTESDAKELQLSLALEQKLVRFSQRDFGKTDVVAGAKLRCNSEINGDHVRYFRVTADGLAISQK